MSAPRAFYARARLRPLRLNSLRSSQSQKWQRSGCRSYASQQGAPSSRMKTLKSDLPWIIGAVTFTVPGLYLVLQSGPIGNPYYHPMPGDNWHGDKEHDDEEEGGEPEEGSQEGMEEGEGGFKEEDESNEGEQEKDADEGNEKAEDTKEKFKGESDPNAKTAQGEALSGEDGQGQAQDVDESGKVSDAKGGVKRKVEGKYARKQGEADSSDANAPAASGKEAKEGDITSKQKGLSNTDTKHAHDFSGEQNLSKKSEGSPETAKLQGTVDPFRKSV